MTVESGEVQEARALSVQETEDVLAQTAFRDVLLAALKNGRKGSW